MERARAAFCFDDDLARACESVLCAVVIFQDRELSNAIDNWQDIDVRQVAGVHVVDAIDSVGGVLDRISVHDQSGASLKAAPTQRIRSVGAADTGNRNGECLEVASVQHQVINLLAA